VDDPSIASKVRERLGGAEPHQTERAVRVTLRVLGESLSRNLVAHVGRGLSPADAATLRSVPERDPAQSEEQLARLVARRARVPVGRALETLRTAGACIGATFDDETSRLAARELGELALLFAVPRASSPPPRPSHAPRSTLSEGRPGSLHPVAASHDQPLAEHPHRLSSSHGLRQEEAGETLASDRPPR